MKRFLALALSLVMILCALLMAGCDQGNTESTTKKPQSSNNGTTASTGGSEGEDPGTENEPTGYEPPSGYADVTFKDRVVVIAGADGETDGFNSAKEIYSEESDRISVAVNTRNALMEQLYQCTIKGEALANPAETVGQQVTSQQKGIDIYTHHYAISSVATGGKVYNLYELGSRDIDFTKDWWDQKYVETYTIKNSAGKNTLYSIIGDFALTAFDCTHALVYNKTVYGNTEEIKDIDIYQLVKDRKWTMAKFQEMIKFAAKDGDGTPGYTDTEGDILGWIYTGHATHGLHAAAGLPIISTNNGAFQYEVYKNKEAWVNVIDTAIETWALPEGLEMGYSSIPTCISANRALFASEILGSSLGNLKDYDVEIGLLPYPLHSESQEDYAHYVDNHVYSYSVPTSVEDIDVIGDFLVLYAYHSKYIVRPVYVNVYAFDYCSDSESADMLDIILDTMTYDPGYLCASNLESALSNLIKSGSNNTVKMAEKNVSTADTFIESYMKGINQQVS